MKKVLSLLLCALIIASLFGCGAAKTTASPTASTSPAPSAALSAAPSPDTVSGPVGRRFFRSIFRHCLQPGAVASE